MDFGVRVLDLNCKIITPETFQKTNQSSQKPHRKETQNLILQGLSTQSRLMTDSSASQTHQTL